jgi:hypothetical protein
MLSLLDAIAGLAQAGDAFAIGVAPWRFLLSRRYRGQVRVRWRTVPAHVATVQQIGGALVLVMELAIVLVAVYAACPP